VGPAVDAAAVGLAVRERAFIALAARQLQDAAAMRLARLEVAFVAAAIGEDDFPGRLRAHHARCGDGTCQYGDERPTSCQHPVSPAMARFFSPRSIGAIA